MMVILNYHNVTFEMALGTAGQLPPSTVPEICFSGRSNVGKSSLINKVLNRKALARVSTKPGKTVTVNFYRLENLRLCDLPGYGYAKVAKSEQLRWSDLMESYFRSGRNIKLVIQLVDMRHPPSEDDIRMLEYLRAAGYPFAIALTKSDKLNQTGRQSRLSLLRQELGFLPEDIKMIPFSAVNGEGVEEIRACIEEIAAAETAGQ